MKKMQQFGGAMMIPVMLMPFAGVIIGLSTVFSNPDIMGGIAEETTVWYKFWSMMYDGGYAIFNQLPLLFAISFPVGLANKAQGRAAVESFVIYLIFNYFIQSILTFWGPTFNVDFTQEAGGVSGLAEIASIKTLDMSILGAILVAFISVAIHNKWYDKKLPSYLSAFQGSALVVIIGFFVMLPLSFLVSWAWPIIQQGIFGMQTFLSESGNYGVWLFTFLERITIPTGLHHFLWTPFDLGPAVVPDGNWTHWMANINEFAASTTPLIEQFPTGGFALYGNVAVWGIPGVALAMYKLALPENKRKIAGLLIPITITSILTGVTEPVEFAFIFVAPLLFVAHSILAATLSSVLYYFGVVGYQGGGLIDYITYNWIPLLNNHSMVVVKHIIIGLIFFVIYYFVAYVIIKKFNYKTPGREKMAINNDNGNKNNNNPSSQAETILSALGGEGNIETLSNCMTRLRITVKDPKLVAEDAVFMDAEAHGVVRNDKSFQVIIGLNVENLKNEIDTLL